MKWQWPEPAAIDTVKLLAGVQDEGDIGIKCCTRGRLLATCKLRMEFADGSIVDAGEQPRNIEGIAQLFECAALPVPRRARLDTIH